jgi:large subunit ribosomal protein L10
MPNKLKEEMIETLAEHFRDVRGLVLADFTGLSVEAATEFRRRCREADTSYLVVKNRLARLAIQSMELSDISDHLRGPTGVVSTKDDPLSPVRIVTEFEKEHGTPSPKVGWIEGIVVDGSEIKRLASLPSRDVLLSQAVAGISSPLAGLVGTLSGVLQGLVTTLDGIAKRKQQG